MNNVTVHELIMALVHQSMEEFLNDGMDVSIATSFLMEGLASAVAETMATLSKSFATDDVKSREAFYTTFKKMVRVYLAEYAAPKEEEPQPPPPPARVATFEARGIDDPYILRTLH